MSFARASLPILLALAVSAPAYADDAQPVSSDTYVVWDAGPCTEPVLMVETDADNVRSHIPAHYPGSDDEFMSHVVTTPGADGRDKATIVFTLNRCAENAITRVVDGEVEGTAEASDTSEVLVMVLFDGASDNAFEFYAFASYVDEPALAGGLSFLGLPVSLRQGLVYDLDASPEQPAPGAVIPFVVEVPGVLRAEGSVVRPVEYGPAGSATHHHHGPRGPIWVEHDAPTGGLSTASATITVTGPEGSWLADLLGADSVLAGGMYLEKEVGHGHTAYLLDE